MLVAGSMWDDKLVALLPGEVSILSRLSELAEAQEEGLLRSEKPVMAILTQYWMWFDRVELARRKMQMQGRYLEECELGGKRERGQVGGLRSLDYNVAINRR